MQINVLGIDLGKNVCSVVGLDEKGQVVIRRRVRRGTLVQFVEKLSPCTIGMEACCGAHHLGRQFVALGHTVRLMPPESRATSRRRRTTIEMQKALPRRRLDRRCDLSL